MSLYRHLLHSSWMPRMLLLCRPVLSHTWPAACTAASMHTEHRHHGEETDFLRAQRNPTKRKAIMMEKILDSVRVNLETYGLKDKTVWDEVEKSVKDASPYKEMLNWRSQVLYHLSNTEQKNCQRFDIGNSLFEYSVATQNAPTLGLLLAYIHLCANHAKVENRERLILNTYAQLQSLTNIFDSTSSLILIRALSKTTEWRVCRNLIDMACETTMLQSTFISPFVAAAVKNGDMELAFSLLEEMAELCLAANDETFEAFMSTTDVSAGEKFLKFCRQKAWIPSENAARQIVTWFESQGHWKGRTSYVKKNLCSSCGDRLERPHALPEARFQALRQAIIDKAFIRNDVFINSHPEEVAVFKQFLDQHTGFDVVVDALNLAFRMHPKASMAVRAQQVRKVVVYLSEQLGKKVLVIGRKHVSMWPGSELRAIRQAADLFLIRDDSSDDPFMIVAALCSGQSTNILTTDEFRDHRHHLRSPQMIEDFMSWQRNHQVIFMKIVKLHKQERIILKWPAFHETRIQHTTSSWHIPFDDGHERMSYQLPSSWICLRRHDK